MHLLFIPRLFPMLQPQPDRNYRHDNQDNPCPVLQMLVNIMQPRTNHFSTHITERGKDQGPGNRAKDVQRQENFRR